MGQNWNETTQKVTPEVNKLLLSVSRDDFNIGVLICQNLGMSNEEINDYCNNLFQNVKFPAEFSSNIIYYRWIVMPDKNNNPKRYSTLTKKP